MKFSGKWRIHSSITFDEEQGLIYLPLDELAARDPEDDSMLRLKSYTIEFTDDGEIITTMPVPEGTTREMLDAARAEGMEVIDDKIIVIERHPWIEDENGTVKINSGIHGETLGEPVDPWVPLEELDGGLLQYTLMRLERIED